MIPMQWTAILLLSLGAVALADDLSDRQKLFGSWEMQGAGENGPASTWTFLATGNAMRVTQLDGNTKVADFECETGGASCEIKVAGKKAVVSLWFNGPRLVEMETKGSDVLKRRFLILPKDDVMEMEVIPVAPGGKTETFQFKRVQLSVRNK
jgi:hypothetical protein